MAREDYPDAWLWQGDVNGDGVIDMADIYAIIKNLRKKASEAPGCDLDGDGWVSILDVEKAGRNFGLTYEVWVGRLKGRLNSMVGITALLSMAPALIIGGASLGRRIAKA